MRLGVTVFLTDQGIAPAELGRAVEERGFSSLYLPEHTHLPLRADEPPALVEGVAPEDYRRGLDPLVALSAAATVTERIELGTGVLLVAQHDPILLAKQVATLDHLSGGRVVLGIGFGWNRAEAEDHGVDFGRRRALAREHVLCMRALWGPDPAEFHGAQVDLAPCWARPKPVQGAGVRVLIGGGAGDAVLGAVAEYGDGWLPIGGSGLSAAHRRLDELAIRCGRSSEDLSVVPFGTIAERGKLEHYAGLGVEEVVLRVASAGRDEVLRELDRLAGFLEGSGAARRSQA